MVVLPKQLTDIFDAIFCSGKALPVTKLTKVMESCHFHKSWSDTRRKRLRCASDTETLGAFPLVHFRRYYPPKFAAPKAVRALAN
jgi:hypothetical protein